MKKQKILNLPNILTLSRIGAVPLLVVIILLGGGGRFASIVAAVVFLVAVLTDLLDGYLARRTGQVTNLGRFLDPLADKLINAAALVMLVPLGRAPAWVAFMIIAREMAVTGLRGIATTEGVVISASSLGKQKTLTRTSPCSAALALSPVRAQHGPHRRCTHLYCTDHYLFVGIPVFQGLCAHTFSAKARKRGLTIQPHGIIIGLRTERE